MNIMIVVAVVIIISQKSLFYWQPDKIQSNV